MKNGVVWLAGVILRRKVPKCHLSPRIEHCLMSNITSPSSSVCLAVNGESARPCRVYYDYVQYRTAGRLLFRAYALTEKVCVREERVFMRRGREWKRKP